MVVTWPSVLVPRRCDPELRNFTRSGGRNAQGREQRVFADAGFWEVTAEVQFYKPEQVRAWRAMLSRIRAGEQVDMRIWDAASPLGAKTANNDGEATIVGNVSLRDTEITMSVFAVEIEDGTYFSIGHRLHVVTDVASGGEADAFYNHVTSNEAWDDATPWSDASPSDRNVTVKIMPPLRQDYSSGTGLRFANLTMRGEIADVSDGNLSLDLGRFGTASITIRESIS